MKGKILVSKYGITLISSTTVFIVGVNHFQKILNAMKKALELYRLDIEGTEEILIE